MSEIEAAPLNLSVFECFPFVVLQLPAVGSTCSHPRAFTFSRFYDQDEQLLLRGVLSTQLHGPQHAVSQFCCLFLAHVQPAASLISDTRPLFFFHALLHTALYFYNRALLVVRHQPSSRSPRAYNTRYFVFSMPDAPMIASPPRPVCPCPFKALPPCLVHARAKASSPDPCR